MAKYKLNPMGLSVIDLITNALAAATLLFVCLAALREPVLPPERASATLFIRFVINGASPKASFYIYLEPLMPKKWRDDPNNHDPDVYFGEQGIAFLNTLSNWLFGNHTDMGCGEVDPAAKKGAKTVPPCAMVFSPKDSSNVFYLVLRDPPGYSLKGDIEYKVGVVFQEDPRVFKKASPVTATINARYVYTDNSGIEGRIDTTTTLSAPTEDFSIAFRALRKNN